LPASSVRNTASPSASNTTDEADARVENAAGIVEVEPSQDLDAVLRETLERYEAG
jgi:hypothetical protein